MKGSYSMLRVAVIEDEEIQRGQIAARVRSFAAARSLPAEVTDMSGAQALVEAYERGDGERYDLILLDIQMPGLDGMSAAGRIRACDERVMIVFITSMAQYAVQGYRVDALDFLVKPVSEAALDACLERAIRRLRQRAPATLNIKSGADLRIVRMESILFAESRDHRTFIRTASEAISCARSLSSLEEELAAHGFFRCHAAFLVSLAAVERLEGNDILAGGQRVPLSKHRRKQFLAALAAYWGEQM